MMRDESVNENMMQVYSTTIKDFTALFTNKLVVCQICLKMNVYSNTYASYMKLILVYERCAYYFYSLEIRIISC